MVEYRDVNLEDINTLDEYFDVFGHDRDALKYLINLFLDQVYDLQEFLEEKGHDAEEFQQWQKKKEKQSYH